MSETVFTLDKNYRVKNKEFHDLLGRLRTGEPTERDADIISNLHIGQHESDIDFMDYLTKQQENNVVVRTKCRKGAQEPRNASLHIKKNVRTSSKA